MDGRLREGSRPNGNLYFILPNPKNGSSPFEYLIRLISFNFWYLLLIFIFFSFAAKLETIVYSSLLYYSERFEHFKLRTVFCFRYFKSFEMVLYHCLVLVTLAYLFIRVGHGVLFVSFSFSFQVSSIHSKFENISKTSEQVYLQVALS